MLRRRSEVQVRACGEVGLLVRWQRVFRSSGQVVVRPGCQVVIRPRSQVVVGSDRDIGVTTTIQDRTFRASS